jgi:hypothetical protein
MHTRSSVSCSGFSGWACVECCFSFGMGERYVVLMLGEGIHTETAFHAFGTFCIYVCMKWKSVID